MQINLEKNIKLMNRWKHSHDAILCYLNDYYFTKANELKWVWWILIVKEIMCFECKMYIITHWLGVCNVIPLYKWTNAILLNYSSCGFE